MNQHNRIFLIIVGIALFFVGYRWFKGRIKKSQPTPSSSTLIVGTNEYPPFVIVKDDAITGFDIDVIREVAKRMNVSLDLKNMSFDALIPNLQLGKIQVIAAGMTPTHERAKRVLFTTPYFEGSSLVIISPATTPKYKSIKELNGKRVAVNQGYFSDIFMSSLEGPELIRLEGSTITEGILALKSDRADVYVTSRVSLSPLEEQGKLEDYHIYPIEGTDEKVALAVSKHHESLLKPIQHALDMMKEDGTLQALERAWKLKND